jgi:leucine dehydrogenase
MSIFDRLSKYDYGTLHLRRDEESGLQAIVAIHDTRLGPALGGCRCIEYSTHDDAVVDALRLARGMTYKAAITGIPHGGGKSVIIRPSGSFDRTALFRAFGQFIDDLRGRYITAEDSGTSVEDMEVIRSVTSHVTGIAPANGGSGDPSPYTAMGVRRGIEACAKFALGRSDLQGLKVAVQGVGHVGFHLCRQLHELGASLVVADIDASKTERAASELGAEVVSLDAIFRVPCDVFAPCALGSAINAETLPALQCKIVAGAANNQLDTPSLGQELMNRGILYAPDYAINAGGLLNVAQEVAGYNESVVRERTMDIYNTIFEISDRAAKAELPTHEVANAMARERLAAAS